MLLQGNSYPDHPLQISDGLPLKLLLENRRAEDTREAAELVRDGALSGGAPLHGVRGGPEGQQYLQWEGGSPQVQHQQLPPTSSLQRVCHPRPLVSPIHGSCAVYW